MERIQPSNEYQLALVTERALLAQKSYYERKLEDIIHQLQENEARKLTLSIETT